MYKFKKGKQVKNMSNENQFFLEFCLSNGAELKITDWKEYHTRMLSINKQNASSTKEKILYILETNFSSYNCVASSHDSNGTGNVYCLYKFHDFFYVAVYSTRLYFYSNDIATLQKVEELTKEFSFKSDQQIYLLTSTMDGVSLVPTKAINEPFIFSNYTEKVVNGLEKALAWSQDLKPKGRILIMSGPPGTGKSYAIRGLISQSTGVDWALIPSYLVPELSSPNIITSLINERPDTDRPLNLIIEDADSLLKKRDENNPDIVSQVLNLGDGIFGELVNVRLIMTTNCPRVNMDDAIVRRGRLNAFIDFELLPKEQAESVFKALANKEIKYDGPRALCDVYADANEQVVTLPKKEVTGNYL